MFLSELNLDNVILQNVIDNPTIWKTTIINIFYYPIIKHFNKRNITPENINDMIEFCEYITMVNMDEFIINNCVATTTYYMLNDKYNEKYDLPRFMTHVNDIESILVYNHLPYLRLLHDNNMLNDKSINYTIIYNNIPCLKLLLELGYKLTYESAIFACENGYIECLKVLCENGCTLYSYLYSYAGKNGHIECIKYLHSIDLKICIESIYNILIGGDVECFKFICMIDYINIDINIICHILCKYGHIECLKIICDYGCELYIDSEIIENILINGYVNILKFLHDTNYIIPKEQILEKHIIEICKYGHLECLKTICDYGCIINEKMAIVCAKSGHLDCLKLLQSYNCPMSEDTICSAIYFPNCVKYLIKSIYPISIKVCDTVAKSGKIECLMYLIDQGLPHNESHLHMIKIFEVTHMITPENINDHLSYNKEYAFSNATPLGLPYVLNIKEEPKFLNNTDDIESIIKYDNGRYLNHYCYNHCATPEIIDYVVKYDNVKILKHLLYNNFPISDKVMKIATMYNSDNCKQILEKLLKYFIVLN